MLTRLTVVEVWLVRALLPGALAAVVVGGTAGAVTLVQAASAVQEGVVAPDAVATAAEGPADGTEDADGPAGPADVEDADRAADGEAPTSDGPDAPTPVATDGPDLVDLADPLRIFGPTPDYAAILSRRFPGAEWSLNANDPAQLTWFSAGTAPTRAELDALWASVAREMARELPEEELARWAGTSETAVYVDGVLRPKGWVGGADDPQPAGALVGVDPRLLPQLAHSNGGSPVGSLDVLRDPTGGQNFEQRYGMTLSELGDLIAAAHGNWGGSHSLGLSLDGEETLMWYSDQVDPAIVAEVLAGIGAAGTPAEGDAG